MKKKLVYILMILFIAFSKNSYSQQASLVISYSNSEKSRDSHSTVENFSLNGENLVYSVKYTGRRGPDQKDESKIQRLSAEQVTTINNIISKYNLNVSDSLINNTEKSPGYTVITAIVISVTIGGKTTKVKVKGDPAMLEDRPLYSNAAYLVGTIRQMIPGTH
jgi:hypothetical protein